MVYGNSPGVKNKAHPSPFPVELPLRCIKMFSWIDSIVYDPFAGIGSTLSACIKTGRNFIGSELSKKYCEEAEKNLQKEKSMI